MNGMNEKNNRNENNCHVFHFENETGEGTITAYDIKAYKYKWSQLGAVSVGFRVFFD